MKYRFFVSVQAGGVMELATVQFRSHVRDSIGTAGRTSVFAPAGVQVLKIIVQLCRTGTGLYWGLSICMAFWLSTACCLFLPYRLVGLWNCYTNRTCSSYLNTKLFTSTFAFHLSLRILPEVNRCDSKGHWGRYLCDLPAPNQQQLYRWSLLTQCVTHPQTMHITMQASLSEWKACRYHLPFLVRLIAKSLNKLLPIVNLWEKQG